jgi:hypothetical protein
MASIKGYGVILTLTLSRKAVGHGPQVRLDQEPVGQHLRECRRRLLNGRALYPSDRVFHPHNQTEGSIDASKRRLPTCCFWGRTRLAQALNQSIAQPCHYLLHCVDVLP